jgi:undecaprenyl-diphosphatase
VAVLPGLSRSGSTIVLALWLGVRPVRAFELSMLISLPAVGGAVLLEGRHISDLGDGLALVALGAIVAFFVGVLALNLLRRSLVRGLFPWFALWVVPLGFATMALAWAWPAR